jgi:hemerythrin superfamily protein
MTGLVVHKAAQVVGEDVQEAIAPLYKVNFKNRAHQEQLKSIVQVLGTRELTGQNPDNSIWGQADDAIAALKGIFGGLSD